MGRAFCIPGIVLLFAALVLSFLVSISLPYLPALDIARVRTNGVTSGEGIQEVRFGIWAPCYYVTNGDRTCLKTGHGYAYTFANQAKDSQATVGSSWTRGLAVHPVATAVIFVAFLLSFSTHVTVTLISSLVSFLAALITLIAFAIDIALFVYLKHQVKKVQNISVTTKTSAGFWMTFATFILLLLAGCTVCFGRRRDRMSTATPSSYPLQTSTKTPFWRRFRRN